MLLTEFSLIAAAVAGGAPAEGDASYTALAVYLIIALGVSSLCSVAEAVFLSVTPAYARLLSDSSPAGKKLADLRSRPDFALSAILTLNTIAHTVGAAGVGLQAALIWGDQWLGLASGIMTVLILVVSEIIPKTIGATYWKRLALPMSLVIRVMITCLKPALIVLEFITERLKPKNADVMSREELNAFAKMIQESATLRPEQSAILGNAIGLDDVKLRTIMTPRTVVFSLPAEGTVREYRDAIIDEAHSRIPLRDPESGEWTTFVLKIDVLASDEPETKLSDLARKLEVTTDNQTVTRALRRAVREQLHILQVVNEYGDAIGLVTLEDMVETLIGQEILDENDEHPDLQAVAMLQNLAINGELEKSNAEDEKADDDPVKSTEPGDEAPSAS